jgi:DNA-binding response OmpR family regulator
MHTHNNYRFARLVIGDADRALRASLQSVLFSAGFRDILHAANTAILTDEINRESIDLILIDLEIPSVDVVTIVQRIRRGLIGRNPYCLIVALATDPTAEKLKEIAIAGVDDILVRPFTTRALMKHLHRLVHHRKSFVLTESYFGPNLRIAPRCDGTDETFQVGVPNTLHAKFVDGVTSEQAIAMVKNTHGRIREAHGKVQQRLSTPERNGASAPETMGATG